MAKMRPTKGQKWSKLVLFGTFLGKLANFVLSCKLLPTFQGFLEMKANHKLPKMVRIWPNLAKNG